jgi:Cys-rich repeat protein
MTGGTTMKKLFTAVGLVLAVALASGCTLYFGPDDDDDRYYSYCDETGCWTCDSYTGECWSDGGPNGCYSDYDCAAGCYCDEASGVCIENGFCSYDTDCPEGFVCDDRASCVPDGSQSCWETGCPWGQYCDSWSGECVPSTTCDTAADCGPGYDCIGGTCTPVGCTTDDQCAAGCYCDEATGGCVESGYCSTDAECPEGQTCDEARSTCIPDETPPPPPPPPACEDLTDEQACLDREDCIPTYTGINCTNPDGTTCESGDSGCTCESFQFAACVSADAPAI